MIVASRRAAARAAPWAPFALTAALPFGAVGLTAAINGGYFPTEWGWPMLVFVLVTVFAVLVRERIVLGRLELAALGAFAAFGSWTLLSLLWAPSPTEPMLSVERLLVYVTFLPAVFLLASRRTASMLPAGVLLAAFAVSAYALATRLFPGRLEAFPPPDGYQLATPIGYWNGLAILAVMGALVALGFASEAVAPLARALAAGTLPVLLTTLYLTFSRGSWAALALGFVVAFAVERHRLRLAGIAAACAPAAAAAVLLARHAHALTRAGASLGAASSAGHRLAAELAVCTAASFAVGWTLTWADRHLRLSARARRGLVAGLVGACVLAAAGVVVRAGGPVALADRVTHSFRAPLPATGGDLNRRLVSLSSNGRTEYWRVAWREVADRPVLGGGAGSYERYWLRDRRTAYDTRNAHSLYLETLAELGPVGLAFLVVALTLPLAAMMRIRGELATAAAAAAYAAFLAHAALDWDWQIPAVTLAALSCGGALLVCARRDNPGALVSGRALSAALAALLPLAAFAIVVQVGNSALARSSSAANRQQPAQAERLARTAHDWTPWSSQPWQSLGEAQLAAGDLGDAQDSLRHAIRLDRTDWSAWYDLAEASSGVGRVRALAEAARLNPLSPEVAALRSAG